MVSFDEKHAGFDEHLLLDVNEMVSTDVEHPVGQKHIYKKKKTLLIIAIIVVGLLVAGPAVVRTCGHRMNKHIQPKYTHLVEPAVPLSRGNSEPNLKPSLANNDHMDNHPKRANSGPMCTSTQCMNYAAFIKSNLAPNYTAIDPCEDFSTYVCGGWRQRNDIRTEQVVVSTGSIMADVGTQLMHEIVEGPYVENPNLPPAKIAIDKENFAKMKSIYNTCMNEDAIKAYGVKPVRDLLEEFEHQYPIAGPEPSADSEGLTKAIIWLAKNSVRAIVSADVTADAKQPDVNVIYLTGGATGLSYQQSFEDKILVANYTRSIAQMFKVIKTGQPIAKELLFKDPEEPEYMESARLIVEFEGKMVNATPLPEIARQVSYYYNPTPIAEMDKTLPEILTSRLIDGLKPAGYQPKFVLNSNKFYFGNLSSVLKTTSRKTVHDYMQANLISAWAGRLHSSYYQPTRTFANLRTGRNPFADLKRWQICLSDVEAGVGWILSAAYIGRAFNQDAKILGDRIINEIRSEFSTRLTKSDWMSPATQELAKKKVANIIQKVGYPTASPNIVDPADVKEYYARFPVSDRNFENGLALNKFLDEKLWNQLLAPVDRARWGMKASTVNAYYSPTNNEIVFPAGIMQFPVFGDQLPEYVSYGSFGSISGHELTHAFDNNGAQYDENGKYTVWWDKSTLANFEVKKQCFIDQFDKFSITGPDGQQVHVNGKLTQGENIADSGGIVTSYATYQKRHAEKPDQHIPGLEMFTREQMFFVSYATWFCDKIRPAQAVLSIYTDVHSPAQKRILGPLANSAGFKEAFQCKNKLPTCELW